MPRTLNVLAARFCGTSCDPHDPAKLKRLAGGALSRAGRTIFPKGRQAGHMLGLSEGLVQLYEPLPDGRRQVVAFSMPGDFLGMPLVGRYGCSADAVSDRTLCRFPRDELDRLIRSSPGMMRRLIGFATRELDIAGEQLTLLGNASAEERVMTFFVDWRDRPGERAGAPKPVPLPMRRQDIADHLGREACDAQPGARQAGTPYAWSPGECCAPAGSRRWRAREALQRSAVFRIAALDPARLAMMTRELFSFGLSNFQGRCHDDKGGELASDTGTAEAACR